MSFNVEPEIPASPEPSDTELQDLSPRLIGWEPPFRTKRLKSLQKQWTPQSTQEVLWDGYQGRLYASHDLQDITSQHSYSFLNSMFPSQVVLSGVFHHRREKIEFEVLQLPSDPYDDQERIRQLVQQRPADSNVCLF